jgi:hypothetical protein
VGSGEQLTRRSRRIELFARYGHLASSGMLGACQYAWEPNYFPSVQDAQPTGKPIPFCCDKEQTHLQDAKASQRQADGLCCRRRLLWLGLI